MKHHRILSAFVMCCFASTATAAEISPAEVEAAKNWVSAKFEAQKPDTVGHAGILVLANNDPVQKRGRGGQPMKILGKAYTRGLYCHAVSHLNVTLPAKAKTLFATIGVDENENTASVDRATVVFVVKAGNRELYRSPLMRVKSEPINIAVPLDGAAEFSLIVEDGDDGIGWDQADWADIRVECETGQTIWLDDLPFLIPDRELTTDPPFSFVYGGKPSAELLATWPVKREKKQLDDKRTQYVTTWNDPATKLEVSMAAAAYHDFPTVEWTVYLKNNGDANTPVISDLKGLDVVLPSYSPGTMTLHHNVGSPCRIDDFMPLKTKLEPGKTKRTSSAHGKPTMSDWPYFNVAGEEAGLIVVVGWAGQWAVDFTNDAPDTSRTDLRLAAGQEQTRFMLCPGEDARSSMTVLQFYYGDVVRSQNIWRQWMLAHNFPQFDGKPPKTHFAACSSHQYAEMIYATSDTQKLFIDRYIEEGIKLDYWWMDAGWYVNKTGWPHTGTWEVDLQRFPGGLRPITDHGRSKGVRSIVWFEPERVAADTWLSNERPEWVLGGKQGGLLNLGHPDAWQWCVEHIDAIITKEGIDLYRQDFNMGPLGFWQNNDTLDRQGMTEMKHVTGYLAFWDELKRRHPNMLIDSCASGGMRNDIETLRRAVPLLRSDFIFNADSNQCQTYGLSAWLPLFGSGEISPDPYQFRSALLPYINCCTDMRDRDRDFTPYRTYFENWKEVNRYFYGDFFPLTDYSLENNVWMAWQFSLTDRSEGMVQVFRRSESPYVSARFRLHELDSDADYTVKDLDHGDLGRFSGRELMEKGLLVTMDNVPHAAILLYAKVQ
ncbi:MAG: alpha-galactosidase [Planctomycetaceae bacterium]|nr:alpha-galactosidase [Planctomycetaceae bacterium]